MLFFSYSRGNLRMVRSVASELRRLGYQTWLDVECLRPGERWREAIERALAQSDAMVYCISHLSLESAWTSVELRAAKERGMTIVPLVIDDVSIERLPPVLREVQLILAAEWPLHETPSRAARAIASSVGLPALRSFAGAGDAELRLRVELRSDSPGAVSLGWTSELGPSPAAALAHESLAELARVADEAFAAELHIGERVEPAVAGLVLGALASRLGPARVRVCADGALRSAMSAAFACVQAPVDCPAELAGPLAGSRESKV